MRLLKIGIVVAKRENGISEIEKYIKSDEVEMLFFPESYLPSKYLAQVQKLAKQHKKWIVAGMDDKRNPKKPINAGIIIDSSGKLLGEHFKTSITEWEIDHGYTKGNTIKVIDTPFGKFGFAICYELYFPEVSRVLTLQGVQVIFNPIGTGMWNEWQVGVWNSFAKTRAYESSAYVLGCSHYDDAIPVGFAYDPDGICLVSSREVNKMIPVTLDLDKTASGRDLDQRRPELYSELTTR